MDNKKIITRKEAFALGLIHYMPGSTCVRGHTAEHYTSSGSCVQCNKNNGYAWRRKIKSDLDIASHPRKEAKEKGEKFYFTGLPCPKGHICPRYTISKMCFICAKERSMLQSKPRRNPSQSDLPETLSTSSKARLIRGRCQSGSS